MAYTDLQIRAFTQIAYMDLEEGFLKNKGSADNPVPLSKLLSSNQYNKLIDMGLTEAEINSWKISAVHNTNDANGFYACVIETSPGNAAVGFRGSESMDDLGNVIHDWVRADLGLLNSTLTNQQREVDRFLKEYQDMLGEYDNLTMTGHSLGGNLAEYATIVSDQYHLDDNIEQCVSMDGPGFSDEFIRKHKDQIEKMNDVMKHYRWSFVGALLNDLPGVDYHFLEVTNVEGEDEYNSFTRHSTVYLAVDENGNFIEGEQDGFSKFTSMLSEGVDHMPPIIGDVLITVIGAMWIGGMWIKEQLFDGDKLTTAGKIVVTSGIVALCTAINVFGLGTVLMTFLEVAVVLVVAVLAVVAIALVFEVIYDVIMAAIDFICDTVQAVVNWAKEKIAEFKAALVKLAQKIKDWYRRNFDKGYKYANSHPFIALDTYKLRGYASRIGRVYNRVVNLDSRMDKLYKDLDLVNKYRLQKADMEVGKNGKLKKCQRYLEDTAKDFENAEEKILALLQ